MRCGVSPCLLLWGYFTSENNVEMADKYCLLVPCSEYVSPATQWLPVAGSSRTGKVTKSELERVYPKDAISSASERK